MSEQFNRRPSQPWETVKVFDRQVERHNGYKQTLRVQVNRSPRRIPDFSIQSGTVSVDGELLHKNVNIGYVVLDDGDVETDDALDILVDLQDEAEEWIRNEIRRLARERREEDTGS